MRAVIIARLGESDYTRSRALKYLLDRPFVHHIIEQLVGAGVLRTRFLVDSAHAGLAKSLGDGKRWGADLSFHQLRDGECPYTLAWEAAAEAAPTRVLLGHVDRLAAFVPPPTDGQPLFFFPFVHGERSRQWSGWGWLSSSDRGWPHGAFEATVGEALASLPAEAQATVSPVLSVRSPSSFLASMRAALEESFPGMIITGRQSEPGLWVGRGAQVDPAAVIVPPVYIGEGVRVYRGVRVGPYAAIGSNSALDRGCSVADAAVLPETYVGEGVELSGVIADGPEVEDGRTGLVRRGEDECVLSRVTSGFLLESVARLSRGLGRSLVRGARWPARVLGSNRQDG